MKKSGFILILPNPLKVRREPAYMAGVAGESISSPGPYDKGGNTYYNVGSLSGWSAERAESYLREYNHLHFADFKHSRNNTRTYYYTVEL